MLRHPFPGLCLPALSRPRRDSCASSRNNLSLSERDAGAVRERLGLDLANVLARDGEQRPTKGTFESDANAVATRCRFADCNFS